MAFLDITGITAGLDQIEKNIKSAQDKALEIEVLKLKANDQVPPGFGVEWGTNAMGMPVAKVVPRPNDPRILAQRAEFQQRLAFQAQENALNRAGDIEKAKAGLAVESLQARQKMIQDSLTQVGQVMGDPFVDPAAKRQFVVNSAPMFARAMQSGLPELQELASTTASQVQARDPEAFAAGQAALQAMAPPPTAAPVPGTGQAQTSAAAVSAPSGVPAGIPLAQRAPALGSPLDPIIAHAQNLAGGDREKFITLVQEVASRPVPGVRQGIRMSAQEAEGHAERIFGPRPGTPQAGQFAEESRKASADVDAAKINAFEQLRNEGIDAFQIETNKKGEAVGINIKPEIIDNPRAVDALLDALRSIENQPSLALVPEENREKIVAPARNAVMRGLKPLLSSVFKNADTSTIQNKDGTKEMRVVVLPQRPMGEIITGGKTATRFKFDMSKQAKGAIPRTGILGAAAAVPTAMAQTVARIFSTPGLSIEQLQGLARLQGAVNPTFSFLTLVDRKGNLIGRLSTE